MKTLKNIYVLIMSVALIGFTSCSSDDTSGGSNAALGTVVASVDGTSFTSLDISSSATIVSQGGASNLIIIASNAEARAFAFTIVGYNGPGTYPFGGGANIFNSGSYTETNVDLANPQNSTTEIWQAPYDSNEVGSITITEETATEVRGNFEFMCKNVNGDQSIKSITNGSFNLTIQ